MVKIRPYVVGIDHVAGCKKKRCGPACIRRTDGLEADFRFVWPNGSESRKREKIPVTSKTAARDWARHRERELYDAGPDLVPTPGSSSASRPGNQQEKEVPTVAEFAPQFMTYSKTNNKPSTVYAKEWALRLHLIPFFGAMHLDRIGPADIESYKAKKLDERLNKKSINNHLAMLRKLLNLAVEWEVIDRAPKVHAFKAKVQLVAADEFLDFDEERRFLDAAAKEWKTYLVTALKTGLRVGELLALKWEDVDLVAGHLIVRRTLWHGQEGPPKGGLNRKVDLGETVLAALKSHRHLRGPYVFCEPDGRRLTHSRLKDVVPSTCRKAQLAKRLTNHGLRHSFASHLVMRGAPLKVVQELLGHESIEMTMRYSHLSPDVKRDAVKLLDATARPSVAAEP